MKIDNLYMLPVFKKISNMTESMLQRIDQRWRENSGSRAIRVWYQLYQEISSVHQARLLSGISHFMLELNNSSLVIGKESRATQSLGGSTEVGYTLCCHCVCLPLVELISYPACSQLHGKKREYLSC